MTRRGSGVQIPHGPQNEQKNGPNRSCYNSHHDDCGTSYSSFAIGYVLHKIKIWSGSLATFKIEPT